MLITESVTANDYYERVGGKLGLTRIHSDHDLVALTQKGVPLAAIQSLLRGGLSDSEVYQLIVPRRTLAHRTANRQPLSKEESDKAIRAARIVVFAELVFGDPERAWRWLRKPKRQFDGSTPIEMLATETGARLVEELIAQIDDGMAA